MLSPVVVFGAAVATVTAIPRMIDTGTMSTASAGAATAVALGPVAGVLMIALVVWCAGVVGESIMEERNPLALAGLQDVARGRLLIPELVPGAMRGYAVAALLLAASAVCAFVTFRASLLPPTEPSLNSIFSGYPALERLAAVITQPIWLTLALLFGVEAFGVRRLPAWAVPAVPALVLAALPASMGDYSAAVETLILVFITGTALSRSGIVTVFVAIIVYQSIFAAVPLLQSGTSHFQLPGVMLLACAAVPGVLAILARRRFDGQFPNASPPTG
jgi:hypothetical protein